MDLSETSYRRYFPAVLLLVSLVALLLLGASYFVEIRIIIEEPQFGDVTEIVRTLWRAILGVTTIGSFLIGVYALASDEDDSDGLPTKVEIKGTGHDIDVYPSGPVSGRDDERDGEAENETRPENDASSSDSDDNVESNTAEEKSAN